jgi:hypothetical protein
MRAHKHMAIDHAADYPVCIQYLALAIASPTYVDKHPSMAEISRSFAA